MLSPKKQKFIDYIRDFTEENQRPPTFVEIMNGLNFSSLGTINWYIVELEKEGIIERVKIAGNKMTSLERSNLHLRIRRLIDPQMMGKNFKVIFNVNIN